MTEKTEMELKISSVVADPSHLESRFQYQLFIMGNILRTFQGVGDNFAALELNYSHLEEMIKYNRELKRCLRRVLKP
jgi:hypothetical protein